MDQTSSAIGRKLQAYLDTLDFRPHLKEVRVPTLLLSGEESPTATVEQQRFMAEQIPVSRLVVYPRLGHGINVLYPEWCAHQIREFLALHGDLRTVFKCVRSHCERNEAISAREIASS